MQTPHGSACWGGSTTQGTDPGSSKEGMGVVGPEWVPHSTQAEVVQGAKTVISAVSG